MREIKFKGKRKADGRWVYGWYAQNMIIGRVEHVVFDVKTFAPWFVDPKTVGQYIDRKDKNGKEIYGGDILELRNSDKIKIHVVCEYGIHRRIMASGIEVDIPSFCFNIPEYENFKSFPIVNNYLGKHDLEIMEIIGNIHDNPGLLK